MPVDDADVVGLEFPRAGDDVAEQRLAGKRLQHLGQVGAHARPLARGENDDTQSQ